MYRLVAKCRDAVFATQKETANKTKQILLMGPLCLSMALLAALIFHQPSLSSLFIAIALSVLLSLKWGTRGAVASIFLIVITFSSLVVFADASFPIWQLGFLGSISISLIMMTLSNEEAVSLISSTLLAADVQVDRSLEKMHHLGKQLEEAKKETERVKMHFTQRIEEYKEQVDEAEKKALEEVKARESNQKQLEETQEKNQILKNELEKLKHSYVAACVGSKDLETQLEDAKAREDSLKQEVFILEERNETLQPYVYDYKQLRAQFEEKKATLNETRKELFALEGKSHHLALELQEKNLEQDSTFEILHNAIKQLEQEKEDLLSEIKHLEEVIGSIIRPLPLAEIAPKLKTSTIKAAVKKKLPPKKKKVS